ARQRRGRVRRSRQMHRTCCPNSSAGRPRGERSSLSPAIFSVVTGVGGTNADSTLGLAQSATGEIGDAALGHGFDAFLEVVGQAQAGLLGKLVLGRGPDALSEAGPGSKVHLNAGGEGTAGRDCDECHALVPTRDMACGSAWRVAGDVLSKIDDVAICVT